jgi:hypothetical protein
VTVGAILLPWYMLGDRKCMKKLSEEPVRDLPNTVKINIHKGKTVTVCKIQAYWGRRGITQLIVILGTRWR